MDKGGGETTTAPDARDELTKHRGLWPSRLSFYFVAVGSAVGFGNVWRFPALAVKYGGGAFFIPYLMALFLIGLPLLLLEIAFGQYFQTGDVNVFGGFHPRFRGVGVASIACGYMLVCYYSMLIAWVINAFFDSFDKDASPWHAETVSADAAIDYFFNDIIGQHTLERVPGTEDDTLLDWRPTRVVGANVGYSFLAWLIIYLCVAFGVPWTGRVTYVTMGLPIVLMFVFLGKSLTLEGHEDGVREYIGIWDTTILREDGEVWSTAVSQIFFSLSVTFGIMTAYGSYCPKGEPAVLNSTVVAISNSLFSFISGFAVFASLGHLAHISGVKVTELDYSGFSLVFGTWPVVLNTLPGGVHWVRLLFFDLFLLGIDSAFSFVEGFATVAHDTQYFNKTPKWQIAGVLSLVGWLIGLMYTTDAGLAWLDVIDFYINFTMLIVGFFETFAAGWIYGINDTVDALGWTPTLMYMASNFIPVAVACGIWFGVDRDDGGVWGGFVALLGGYAVGLVLTMAFLQDKMLSDPDRWTWKSIFWELSFKNIYSLTERIEPVVGHIPFIWCVLVKQFIPPILLILFVNLARSQNGDGEPQFGHYGGYVTEPFQILGILTFVFAASLFTIGFLFPQAYYFLRLPEGHLSLEKVEEAPPSATKDVAGEDIPVKDIGDEPEEVEEHHGEDA